MIHDSPLIPSRLGERDGERQIAARKSAADARRAASGLDNPIAVGSDVAYESHPDVFQPARVLDCWKATVGFVYRIALASGDAVNVAGDRLEGSEK